MLFLATILGLVFGALSPALAGDRTPKTPRTKAVTIRLANTGAGVLNAHLKDILDCSMSARLRGVSIERMNDRSQYNFFLSDCTYSDTITYNPKTYVANITRTYTDEASQVALNEPLEDSLTNAIRVIADYHRELYEPAVVRGNGSGNTHDTTH